ncbi:hypothetical protein A2116_01690 [Candidatus Jorgensenbacteria bacterium GWA1_49_17]|uniref:Uncharacterized protein n=1 Tax=Candidatus Jorgensenbacteria bacterium GWA1_49_17 TaxID=1798467 RepID=A0A1F6BU72_9BACT|nr:MAG: hypothetical protein A2116_01690 [Candidatus Jorgensenbacteria bacterium GWA1_49_17]
MKSRRIFVWCLALIALVSVAACDDGTPTEPIIGIENFEFSATIERTGPLGGALADHTAGVTPQWNDFYWPISSVGEEYIGRWSTSTAEAHTLGVAEEFGSIQPGATPLVIEWNLEWVNGPTTRPVRFSPATVVQMNRRYADGVVERVDKIVYFVRPVGPNHWRAEFQIPATAVVKPNRPSYHQYEIYFVVGATVECRAEGTKSFIVSGFSFSGAGFGSAVVPGKSIFTPECRRSLVRYSVVSG